VNGDNLLAIRDEDVATAFAIEALALVDHFNFLDRAAAGPKAKKKTKPKTNQAPTSSRRPYRPAGSCPRAMRGPKNTSTVLIFISSIASCLPAELISVPASAF